MKSFCLTLVLLLLAIPPALCGAASDAAKKLNVLFLVADDLNCDLGAYGATYAHTPNLDALAARSVRFERAYTQFPHCSPSRASFLTGRRPNVTGVYGNPTPEHPMGPHFREKISATVTLPQLFKQHGWFSARVGKLFHYGVPLDIGTSSLDDFYSWDLAINPRGRDRDNLDQVFSLVPGRFGGVLSWHKDEEGSGAEQTDGIAADEAIRLLERFRREERPFFLAVGFYRPHTPYVAPAEYFDLHPIDAIELPELSAADRARQPTPAYAVARAEQDAMTDGQRREAIQAYRASTSFMDAQVGRVLAALKSSGLAENTIVVFTSDHGYHLGDHGLWQKLSLFERSTHVPLLISAPGAKGNGRTAEGVAALLDLYPTLAELCGLPAPDYLDGVSLRAVLDDPAARPRTYAVSQVRRPLNRMGYAVRTERWRYIAWDSEPGDVQLFDMETDPGETTNRVSDPECAAIVVELHAVVEREKAVP
jgi:arylsulfatase A-like enzyme